MPDPAEHDHTDPAHTAGSTAGGAAADHYQALDASGHSSEDEFHAAEDHIEHEETSNISGKIPNIRPHTEATGLVADPSTKLTAENLNNHNEATVHSTEPPEPAEPESKGEGEDNEKELGSPQEVNHGARADRSSKAFPPPAEAETTGFSAFSHQQMAPKEAPKEAEEDPDGGWQEMPAYAQYDLYDDDGKIVARAHDPNIDDPLTSPLHGAGKGYSRVQDDEDAKSATSMDDNTAYLFKSEKPRPSTDDPEDEDAMSEDEARDPLAQMQATKNLLSENQKIAYVGLVRLAIADMSSELTTRERTRAVRKILDLAIETNKMFTQKVMIRLYQHMELDQAEQVMIEQLAEHGLQASDLTPTLMANSRVNNPVLEQDGKRSADGGPREEPATPGSATFSTPLTTPSEPLPAYSEHINDDMPDVQTPAQLPRTSQIDIDLRWTVLCDLFLILIADSFYDAPSRVLLERVGKFLNVEWLDICRFEKRITDALEMEEDHEKETWTEEEHIEKRRKRAKRRRLMMVGLATVGGSLVIGLSAGLLAPVIGAGLAAGFTTIGVTGTSGFLAGAGGASIVATTGVVTGAVSGAKAATKRTGAVATYEYRPLFNNKRVNLIVTVSGWLIGKVDDVRLPFSTIDPIMGDVYSIYWEPEMLQSMGQTIGILATEALTQGLQQLLGSTILMSLMAALQLPLALSKLSYLIDNPWSNSMARADRAGLILADSLIDRNLGARPITLVGFSIGARVIYAALQELSKRGAVSLVQNVYLFGSPVVVNKDEYLKARTVVTGRFVNGYAVNDWILGYLFRMTAGGIARVAGLSTVDVPGIENIDVTKFVSGHMAYRTAMPKILREVGWAVTSDEFSEIEDPDPDNHEKRQRELISEIEAARRDLQEKEKNEKKGFAWFRKKKAPEKKSWEIYDDAAKPDDLTKEAQLYAEGGDVKAPESFDVAAIRRAAVEVAATGLEVKQLETTLPPLKLDSGAGAGAGAPAKDVAFHPRPSSLVLEGGAHSRSHSFESVTGRAAAEQPAAPPVHEPKEEDITMTFDSEFARPAWPRRHASHLDPAAKKTEGNGNGAAGNGGVTAAAHESGDIGAAQQFYDDDDEDEFKEKEVELSFA